jgi:hypothetical protein
MNLGLFQQLQQLLQNGQLQQQQQQQHIVVRSVDPHDIGTGEEEVPESDNLTNFQSNGVLSFYSHISFQNLIFLYFPKISNFVNEI